MPYLLVFECDQHGVREVALEKKKYLLGRDGGVSDIQFANRTVSRSHAYLSYVNNYWFIEDAGSRSGTFLNGVKIKRKSILKDAATIQLGDATIEFHSKGLTPSEILSQTTEINPVDLKMQMSFRPMPKAIRIECRLLDLDPKEVFAKGDTLLVGDGGMSIAYDKPLPMGAVVELSIASPGHKPKTFLGEIMAVLKYKYRPDMCIKLHMPKDENGFLKIIEQCRRSPWMVIQQGSSCCSRKTPRSSVR